MSMNNQFVGIVGVLQIQHDIIGALRGRQLYLDAEISKTARERLGLAGIGNVLFCRRDKQAYTYHALKGVP